MGGPFSSDADNILQSELADTIDRVLKTKGVFAWTLAAKTKRQIEPVGIVAGWVLGNMLIVSDGIFFPWATKRNVHETLVHFFDSMRKIVLDENKDILDPTRYMVVMHFAKFEHKRFYESLDDAGIMRRVGHVLDIEERSSVLFQSRSPVT